MLLIIIIIIRLAWYLVYSVDSPLLSGIVGQYIFSAVVGCLIEDNATLKSLLLRHCKHVTKVLLPVPQINLRHDAWLNCDR